MSEDDPLVGAYKVAAVLQAFGGRGAHRVEREHARRDEFAVKTVTDGITAHRGHHQPHGIDFFSAMQGDGCDRQCAAHRDSTPHGYPRRLRHGKIGLRCKLTARWPVLNAEYCGELKRTL